MIVEIRDCRLDVVRSRYRYHDPATGPPQPGARAAFVPVAAARRGERAIAANRHVRLDASRSGPRSPIASFRPPAKRCVRALTMTRATTIRHPIFVHDGIAPLIVADRACATPAERFAPQRTVAASCV
ncbi:hypothetical protein QZM52_18450 [Burkholderia metallica]|uniref:Uncharacterized protein n=1 Tax=Burkholderia metallica TaxID=488729 RepID=A0ABT8PDQ1_9BURK|nr:hypothetical protein [Burkholderia metallica]MDN7933269.1 hypothetical protein [Burkholderia metallica]